MDHDAHGSFETHANYVRAFALLAGAAFPVVSTTTALRAVERRVRRAPSVSRLQVRECDASQLRTSLANAWLHELQLDQFGTTAREEVLVRVTNGLAVVLVYYVFYHATQAFYVARGNARPESHETTRKIYANTWAERDGELLPWCLGARHGGYANVPVDRAIDEHRHSWSAVSAASALDLAAKSPRPRGSTRLQTR